MMTRRARFSILIPAALLAGWGLQAVRSQTFGQKIGIDLDGIGGLVFVDAAKELRPWEAIGGGAGAKDANGWPQADARTVLFDYRPVPAWAPPIDDPDKKQIDVSGTYKVSFNGQASLSAAEEPENWTVANQKYDPASNRTTLDLTLKKGKGLVFINFTKTRRTPDAAEGTGLTNLRAIRPGYPADTKQTFCNEYLRALKPFAYLRFMDFTDTNGQSKDHGAYPKKVTWKERTRTTDCTQVGGPEHRGAAWEYVVELANLAGKDAWINVPVEADDDYVRELAKLLKTGLNPNIKLYIEHGNEVWNYMFPACT